MPPPGAHAAKVGTAGIPTPLGPAPSRHPTADLDGPRTPGPLCRPFLLLSSFELHERCGPQDQWIPSTALCPAPGGWIPVTAVRIPRLPQEPALCPNSLHWHLFAKEESPFSALGSDLPTLFAFSVKRGQCKPPRLSFQGDAVRRDCPQGLRLFAICLPIP